MFEELLFGSISVLWLGLCFEAIGLDIVTLSISIFLWSRCLCHG